MRYTAYIGIGSNLFSIAGDPAETVTAAIAALLALGTVTAQSSLYRTVPVGYLDQPYFINAVVCLGTVLDPRRLLDELLGLERRFGRDRQAGVPKGPRTLDLDILLVWKREGKSDSRAVLSKLPDLKLPHPEIVRRRFVLEPLAEIAPSLRHPVAHRTIRELLRGLAAEGDGEGRGVVQIRRRK